MLNLILGGAGSGKSAFAERLVCSLSGPRIYLATMTATDGESLQRISKHRQQREGLGFETLERGTAITGIPVPPGTNLLLEDLANLLANEMFRPEGQGLSAVQDGLLFLAEQCRSLTVVSNEIFSDGINYEGETLRYLKNLAQLNRMLAAEAELVVEIVCGLPNVLKGRLPCF